MSTDAWTRVAKIAAKHFGIFTTAEALQCGLSRNGIAVRERRGDVERAGRGIYRFAWAAPTPEHRLFLTVLACGPAAVASHTTAAALWELGDLKLAEPFHILVPDRRKRAIEGVVLHSSATIDRLDVTVRGVMPVTTPWRTTVDACGLLPIEEAEDLAIEVLRRRMADERRLRDVIDRMGTAPGTAVVRHVLRSFDAHELARLMSWLEATVLRELRRRRLPTPEVNRRIVNQDGHLIGKVDFIWDWADLVVEVDGLRWHSLPSQKRYDDDRQNAFVLSGRRVLRFGARKIREEMDEVMETVARALATT